MSCSMWPKIEVRVEAKAQGCVFDREVFESVRALTQQAASACTLQICLARTVILHNCFGKCRERALHTGSSGTVCRSRPARIMVPGLLPLSLRFVRRRSRKDNEHGSLVEESVDLTRDGTVDVHGRPASKRRCGSWKGASFVLADIFLSNLPFYAVSTNLLIYLTTVMHASNASAAKNVTNWSGAGYLVSLFSAFVADTYSGRFWAGLVSNVVNIIGSAMITIAGSMSYFRPAQCADENVSCDHASAGQSAFLYAGLYVMNFAQGGIYGSVIPFGADQFDEEDETEKLQKSSFFNWNYMSTLGASFVASSFFVYIESNVSTGIGWGIACGAQIMATAFFLMGARLYRYHNPGGNPLSRMAKVLVAAVRKRRAKICDPGDLYEIQNSSNAVLQGRSRRIQHSNGFGFLDRAAIVSQEDQDRGMTQNSWHLCTVTQVEEVKYVLGVIPIFLTTIMYTTVYSQLTTLFLAQGYSMERRIGSFTIPAASLGVFESLSVFFWVILYDRILVPLLRKRTGNQRGISELQRIGVGMFLSILSMSLAALVETYRLRSARVHGLLDDPVTPVPLSVFWLIPQYFSIGASEVCVYIGQLEFFYDQAPDAIRSLAVGLSSSANSLGFFLSTLVLIIVGRITRRKGRPGWIADNLNRGRVDLYYWLLAGMSFINLLAFLVCAHRYEYSVTEGPVNQDEMVNVEASYHKLKRDRVDELSYPVDPSDCHLLEEQTDVTKSVPSGSPHLVLGQES